MDISLFDYNLPEELIAQRPAARRDGSRLLVYDRSDGGIEDKHFYDIVDHIGAGDVLVLNDSKVIRARLIGAKASTGARIEVFLVRRRPADDTAGASADDAAGTYLDDAADAYLDDAAGTYLDAAEAYADSAACAELSQNSSAPLPQGDGATPQGDVEVWEALVKPSKRVKQGDVVAFSDELQAEMIGDTEDGGRLVRFTFDGVFDEIVDRLGHTPLPPYIHREADATDDARYQTVYSKIPGSVAAPTAGLHFTDELIGKVKEKGAEIVFVTLHVGLGTFRPVKADTIEAHHMHTEEYYISEAAATTINKAKGEGRRIICVGTTSVRTLESAAAKSAGNKDSNLPGDRAIIAPGHSETAIFIYPGYEFKIADALITNFHLPKSTLFMLVSAFAGRARMLDAYKHAIDESYRFFSYGDAMLIHS